MVGCADIVPVLTSADCCIAIMMAMMTVPSYNAEAPRTGSEPLDPKACLAAHEHLQHRCDMCVVALQRSISICSVLITGDFEWQAMSCRRPHRPVMHGRVLIAMAFATH